MSERNRFRIFLASFLTLIAAGVGFAIRNKVLEDWGGTFGFTKQELGQITGGGFVGFGVFIIAFSFVADRIGYKRLLLIAFVLHVLSALVTVAASFVYEHHGRDATYQCLYYGMFLFALANGACETAINPLTATLYPERKTHWLNVLHAGWPGGLILGGLLAYGFVGEDAAFVSLRWEIPMLFFMIPVLIYGVITLKEHFPHSETKAAGVTFGAMFSTFFAPLLILLFGLHAVTGYVELGTDSWSTNIVDARGDYSGILFFSYAAGIMFVLRFFAGPIVERINPLGLLFVSSLITAAGLWLIGTTTTGVMIFVAFTVFGIGKTFLWPTMLGVVGERFPHGGALAMGTIGGIGMLSAGLLGGPGIGYFQDRYASEHLAEVSPRAYAAVQADEERSFLIFEPVVGLDGKKVEELPEGSAEADVVARAGIEGGAKALEVTALVPLGAALIYLLLILGFRARGGYRALSIDEA